MAEQRATDEKLLANQRRRLQKLERQRQKLIDAYLAEALPVADLKHRREALAVEQREAERLQLASTNHAIVEERLEIALGLLEHCARLYAGETDKARRDLNQAFLRRPGDRQGRRQASHPQPALRPTHRSQHWPG